MGYALKIDQIGKVPVGERIKVFPTNHRKDEGDIIGVVVRSRSFANADGQQNQVEVRLDEPVPGEIRSYGQGTRVGVIQNTRFGIMIRDGDLII